MTTSTKPKRPAPPPFKAVVRSATASMEISGSIKEGILYSFHMVSSREARDAILADLNKAHAKLIEREAERANHANHE